MALNDASSGPEPMATSCSTLSSRLILTQEVLGRPSPALTTWLTSSQAAAAVLRRLRTSASMSEPVIVFFLSASSLKFLNTSLQLLIRQLIAHGLELFAQGVLAGVLAKHHRVLRDAHVGGLHDLIRLGIGDDAVLVDAGLMREGVRADNGLAGRDRHAGDIAREQLAGSGRSAWC